MFFQIVAVFHVFGPQNRNGAAVAADQAEDQLNGRALPGAVFADKAHDAACGKCDIYIPQGKVLIIF